METPNQSSLHRRRHHHHVIVHPNPLSPHHHHHVILPQCALHKHFPQIFNINPSLLVPQFLQNPNSSVSLNQFPTSSSGFEPSHPPCETQMLQDDGALEFDEGGDEDPIYVMTDEWRDFFAKSEARRREAKKLAKRQVIR